MKERWILLICVILAVGFAVGFGIKIKTLNNVVKEKETEIEKLVEQNRWLEVEKDALETANDEVRTERDKFKWQVYDIRKVWFNMKKILLPENEKGLYAGLYPRDFFGLDAVIKDH